MRRSGCVGRRALVGLCKNIMTILGYLFYEVRGKKKKLGIYMCMGTKRREKERVVGRFE